MSPEPAPAMMKELRPFYARATVSPTPVDSAETASGLIVPLKFDGSAEYERGVLLGIANEPPHLGADQLEPGMVVFYRGGVRIGDVVIVELANILAYEP